MTLLITVFAAIIATIVWYKSCPKDEMKVGTLCWLYWGASVMWLVDALFEYAELKEEYFMPAPEDMINDTFLGLAVVALGLIIWLMILMIRDPQGKIRAVLKRKTA
jgi:hypothetical protein